MLPGSIRPPPRCAELAAFIRRSCSRAASNPRLTIARDRESLDARLNRLDASMALAVEGAVRTREVLTLALREANLDLPAANSEAIAEYNRAGGIGRGRDARAAADRSYLESAIQVAGAYELLAAAAESIPRMRGMREYLAADWTARHARRTWRQGKCLATIGDRFR